MRVERHSPLGDCFSGPFSSDRFEWSLDATTSLRVSVTVKGRIKEFLVEELHLRLRTGFCYLMEADLYE
jgi:hypothetical protein